MMSIIFGLLIAGLVCIISSIVLSYKDKNTCSFWCLTTGVGLILFSMFIERLI